MKLNRELVIKKLEAKRAALIREDNAEGKKAQRERDALSKRLAAKIVKLSESGLDALSADEAYEFGNALTNYSYSMEGSRRSSRRAIAWSEDGNFLNGSNRYTVSVITREIALMKLSTDESVTVRNSSDLASLLS